MLASGLPVVLSGTRSPRPRLVFAASLPAGAGAEADLADLLLHQARPVWDVRVRLLDHLPGGVELVDLFDVWLGEPALPALVVAADWQVRLVEPQPASDLAAAAAQIMAATTLPRERPRGTAAGSYDLRPLVEHIEAPGPAGEVSIRTRFHPERGVGRPDEVVRALAERLGQPLTIGRLVRSRLILDSPRADPRDHSAVRQSPRSAASRRGRK